MTRTEHSIRNLRYALVFQTLALLTAFLTRRVFVSVLTQEHLGLDGAFSNLLVTLSLAELGLGEAITFSLYKPLAEKDTEKLRSLMALYRRAYRAIGILVAALGCALAPFLPKLNRDFPAFDQVYLIYFLFLANSVLSYFFVYKQSLILADQRRYLITVRRYGLWTLLYILQALFLYLTREYLVYLALQIGETLLENLLLARKADALYPFIRERRASAPLDGETRKTVIRNTKAMFLHKLGGAMVFNTDNLLLSYFTGVASVGVYSNYLLVVKGLRNFYKMAFAAFSGSVGNLGATEGREASLRVYRRMSFAGSWMMGAMSICLAALFNAFIELWVGRDYLFPTEVVLLIVLNFYVTGMREVNQTFQNSYGLFWHMRYKSVVEAAINLAVSIALARPLGVAGILLGTFASTMLTSFWVEPYIVFRYALQRPLWRYFLQYAAFSALTLAAGGAVWFLCGLLPGSGIPLFLGKAAVSALLPSMMFGAIFWKTEELRFFLRLVGTRIRGPRPGLINRDNLGGNDDER